MVSLEDDYKFTLKFKYNQINSIIDKVDEYKNQIACLILEPANSLLTPENNFLEKIKVICEKITSF